MIPLLTLAGLTVFVNPGLVTLLSPIPTGLLPVGVPFGTYVDGIDFDGTGRSAVQGTPAAVAAALGGGPPPASVDSGVYSPVLTPNAPTIAGFTADPWQWQRVLDVVTVHGQLVVSWPGYVAGLVTGQIIASLPVPPVNPNLGLVGVNAGGDVATGLAYPGSVSQAVNDASLGFATLDGAANFAGLSFSYRLTF